jgi:hypothetical protein
MRIRARQRGRPETVCAYLGVIGQVAVQIPRQRIEGVKLGRVRRQTLRHMLVDQALDADELLD